MILYIGPNRVKIAGAQMVVVDIFSIRSIVR
jgi:hypothetical protein